MAGKRIWCLRGLCAAIALCATSSSGLAMQQASVPPPAALVPVPAHPDEAAARHTAKRYQQLLADHRWQLTSAKDREGNPRTWFASATGAPGLEFSKEEKDASAEPSLLLHSQLCQRQVDGWLVLRRYQVQGADPQREVAWQLTLRGDAHVRRPALTCRTSAYNAEQRLLQMLSGGHALRMRIDQPNKGGPQLEVDDGFGGVLRFQGTLLAESQRHHLQGVETLLQVKETAAPCASSWAPGERCLLFREVRLDGDGDASVWNDNVLAVDRYTHVAGTEVMLRVSLYGKAQVATKEPVSYRAERLLWARGDAAGADMMPTVAGVTAAAVLEPEQVMFYPPLLRRFSGRDRSLAEAEFSHLYYGHWLRQALGPRHADTDRVFPGGEELAAIEGYLELRRQLAALDKAGGSATIRLQLYRDFLARHPLHLNALEDMAASGDADVRFVFEGLLQAIKASGDGMSCDSPWIVTSSGDIGVVFRQLALERDYDADRPLDEGCLRVGADPDVRHFLVLDQRDS